MKPRKEYWKEPIWIRRSKTDIPLKWPQLSPSPRPRWWSTIGRIQLEGSRVKSSVWCSNFRAVLWTQIWFWWYFECERTHFQRGVEWLVMAVQMCYNRGCGKEYNIRQNFEDSCRWKGQKHRPIENLAQNHHHNADIILVIPIFTMPTRVGAVVRFWTLCKCDLIDCIFFSQNKSTDFTTFLNTPGCALGKHSNVKPINPEKITGNLNKEPEPVVVETRPPIQPEGEIRKCNLDLRW